MQGRVKAIYTISPKAIAPQYQPIERKKGKGKQWKTKWRVRW